MPQFPWTNNIIMQVQAVMLTSLIPLLHPIESALHHVATYIHGIVCCKQGCERANLSKHEELTGESRFKLCKQHAHDNVRTELWYIHVYYNYPA